MAAKRQIDSNQHTALNVYVKLMRATSAVTTRMHRHLKDKGLTSSQFGVLEALYHLGPLCQQEIGNKILKTSGNMTMVIDNLEKRGLVVREKDPHDRRYLQIHLTRQGNDLISKVFPHHAGIAESVFAVLDAHEQKQLGMLLKKLGRG
jgi:MarR family 2-MHQ and catechol resistance regulon transcriptional repressor